MARPLRVLLTRPQLNAGGAATPIVALAGGLKKRGHEVTVVSGGGALVPQLEAAGIDHITLPVHRKNLFTMLGIVPRLREIIQSRGIQVVHAHSRVPAWISYLATRSNPRVTFLVTAHGHYNAHLGSSVVRKGHRVIAISQSVRDHVHTRLNVPMERLDVIYNGLDASRFDNVPAGSLRASLEQDGFLPKEGFLVGNLGRLSRLKGLDTLLEAAAWIKEHQPAAPLRFVIIGEGPEQRHLAHRVQELNLQDRVRLLAGVEDPKPPVRDMDVFALPSVSEGMGLAGLEAMLLGVPVVACQVPGLMELVDDKVGRLAPPRDGEAFAKALWDLYENPALRRELAQRAGAKARDRFSLERMALDTENVYRHALEERHLAHDKLHILQLIPELKVGGNERGVVDLSRWLVSQGHRVTVVSHGGRLVKDVEEVGARHVAMNVHSKSPWVAVRAVLPLRRLLHDQEVHLIDAHSRVPAWIAWLACMGQRRVAFVTTAHGDYRAHMGSLVMAWGQRVIAVSAMIATKMQRDFHVPDQRLRQVHRWVDLTHFDPATTQPAGLRQQLGNPQRLVGILGRITHWKGHEVLIEAAALLQERGLPTHIAVVGEPSPGKDTLLASLKEKARKLGVADLVHFVGFRADVPSVVLDLDIVAHCSTDPEPFGRVLLEAMAMERPVIGTSPGGGAVDEIVHDGVNGKLVPPKDPTALADAIAWFFEDPARARNIAAFAAKDVRERFDLSAMAAKTLAIYYEALAPEAPALPEPHPEQAPQPTPGSV